MSHSAPGNSTTETGAVSFNGTTSVTSGNTLAINNTPTLGSLGITSAADLRIVFNAQEPGNAANSITLDNLVLNIYGQGGGTPLFTSTSFTSPITFPTTQTGVGNSGVVFALDAADAAKAQAAAFGTNFANNRIGLSASASDATGGLETFYALSFGRGTNPGGGSASGGGVGSAAVPEPGTVALLGLGLLGVVATRRRKA